MILFFPVFLSGQGKFYSVKGRVLLSDGKIPANQTEVILENAVNPHHKTIKTDEKGFYKFDSLAAGNYQIKAKKKGYFNSNEIEFTITNKNLHLKTITLEKQETTTPFIPIIFAPFTADSFDKHGQLDSIAKYINQSKVYYKIQINAYADSCEINYNNNDNDTTLAYRRGLTIKNALISKGVKTGRLHIKPLMGYDFLRASKNDCSIEGIRKREVNRSIQFTIKKN